jgi:hypothetical protein
MTFNYNASSKPEQIAYDAGVNEAMKDDNENEELYKAIYDIDCWLRTGKWSNGISPTIFIADLVRRLPNL